MEIRDFPETQLKEFSQPKPNQFYNKYKAQSNFILRIGHLKFYGSFILKNLKNYTY